MITTAQVLKQKDGKVLLEVDLSTARQIVNLGTDKVEVRPVDPRCISSEQRKKAYALERDIADWMGDMPLAVHEFMKVDFYLQNDISFFSLSDCEMTTARLYITFLIDFCIYHGVPTKQPLYAFCDDLEAYVYQCLANRRCAVHNSPYADIHHCTGSRVGMGRDRREVVHEGLKCLPLCRECHNIVHQTGELGFLEKHHLAGISLDNWLCQKLGLNTIVD